MRLLPVAAVLLVVACRGSSVAPRAGNHLAGQTSPYLLEHAGDPVDWYPWGEEAFRAAIRQDRPIFLSIGYSSCHWCHVMEKESFEDPEVARLLNETFVCIIVDREERPDVDRHFLAASRALNGTGGWPLTVLMTPRGAPFFAATYLPRQTTLGSSGLLDLIPKVSAIWKSRRGQIEQSGNAVLEAIRQAAVPAPGGFDASPRLLRTATEELSRRYDASHGGFGGVPRFPVPAVFPLLLRAWARDGDPKALQMAERSLTAMRNGAIFDQLGFGFHRYATDARWRWPHFEKMLYDQALLAMAYTDAWRATGKAIYRRTAEEILDYAVGELRLPEGGFASAEDADSQGEEGRYYLWTPGEIDRALGPRAPEVLRRYHVTASGNLPSSSGARPGQSVLYRGPMDTSEPGEAEAELRRVREQRPRPARDETVLADWNGLMIAALAQAGGAFDDASRLREAEEAATFLLATLQRPGGRLLHRCVDGKASVPGFADDYAFVSWGLLELYEATQDAAWLQRLVRLMDTFLSRFWDSRSGGFFQTAVDLPSRLGRTETLVDGEIPSANSIGLMVLLKLNRLTGVEVYQRRAEALLRRYPSEAASNPLLYASFLCAADFAAGPSREVVVAGVPTDATARAMLRAIRSRFLPNTVTILRPTDQAAPLVTRLAPFTEPQRAQNGKTTIYVCTGFTCDLPTTDVDEAMRKLVSP